jgi:hypothetical protein
LGDSPLYSLRNEVIVVVCKSQFATQESEALWFLMHQSDDPKRISLAVTCYSDDSASHEESEWVVVGGVVMNKHNFLRFDHFWKNMLKEFRIEFLHMTDFTRPYGRYSTMPREMKIALFTTVAGLINDHKTYSISVAVPQAEFKALLSMEVYRKLMGPYALAFLITIAINCQLATMREYEGRIGYLVDKGSTHHHEQLNGAHSLILEWEKHLGRDSKTGAIAFDYDERVSALQAADAIAWAYHRKQESLDFGDEFSPLLKLFEDHVTPLRKDTPPHIAFPMPKEGVQMFADSINSWVHNYEEMPSFLSLIKIANEETDPEESGSV